MASNSQAQRIFHGSLRFRNGSRWGVALGTTLLGVFLSALADAAAVFTVNSPSDVGDANPGNGICETASGNGVCTLRAAIQETNFLAGDDTIILPPTIYLLTQVDELTITDNLTITGGGASTTIIDGNKLFRLDRGVLTIRSSVPIVNISGVTVRNGTATSDSSGKTFWGGGIFNSGTLTLTNSVVSGNASADNGGGIYNDGTLTLINSTVSGNDADFLGGGILNSGTLTLINSTVSGNTRWRRHRQRSAH